MDLREVNADDGEQSGPDVEARLVSGAGGASWRQRCRTVALLLQCLDESAIADVALFDAQGRRIRTLPAPAVLTSGLSEWRWDGRDDRGRILPSGRYWARASVPAGASRIPLVLIR